MKILFLVGLTSLLCFSFAFSAQALVAIGGIGVVTNEESGYIDVKPLEKLGLSVVISDKANRAYVIYGRKIIIAESDGKLSVDFLEVYERAALIKKDAVMIRSEVLGKILGLAMHVSPNGNTILIDSIPILKSVDFTEGSLVLNFEGPVFEQMFKVSTMQSKVRVEISPCFGQPTPVHRVALKQDGAKFIVEATIEEDVEPSASVSFSQSGIEISLRYPGFGRERVGPGVFWEQVVEKIGGKEMLVNYLWIDPRQVDLRPTISSGGIGTVESVDRMVLRTKAIAGINANYFDVTTKMPIGLIVVDGKVLSLPYGNRPIFVQTKSGEVHIARAFYELNIRLGQLLFLVKGVNTVAIGDVLIFTEEFGLPIPRREDTIYFKVENNRITGTGWIEKAPTGGYVLAISSRYANYLQAIQPGDRVELVVSTDFSQPIRHAVEAGPLIIYNGLPLPDKNDEKNRYGGGIARASASRTLVATLPDGRVVFAVINDQNGSSGVNYDELVDFCLQKGFHSAMNFDGGSSAVMVVRNEIVSKMFSDWIRNIPVGMLVIPRNN